LTCTPCTQARKALGRAWTAAKTGEVGRAGQELREASRAALEAETDRVRRMLGGKRQ
jgi:hypothetical protein